MEQVAIYYRVSTDEQEVSNQIKMLEEIKVYPERYLTINIRINNILFEDDTKYYF